MSILLYQTFQYLSEGIPLKQGLRPTPEPVSISLLQAQ